MAKYLRARGSASELHHFCCLVENPKNPKDNLSFVPSIPLRDGGGRGFESEKVGKDYAALLALFHLQRTIPLERKLPEPYRSSWLHLQKNGGGSGSSSTSSGSGTGGGSSAPRPPRGVAAVAATAKGTTSSTTTAAAGVGSGISALPPSQSKQSVVPAGTGTATGTNTNTPGGKRNPVDPNKGAPAVVLSLKAKFTSAGSSSGNGGGAVLSRTEREQLRLQKVARQNARTSRLKSMIAANKHATVALGGKEQKLFFEVLFRCCEGDIDPDTVAKLFPADESIISEPTQTEVALAPGGSVPALAAATRGLALEGDCRCDIRATVASYSGQGDNTTLWAGIAATWEKFPLLFGLLCEHCLAEKGTMDNSEPRGDNIAGEIGEELEVLSSMSEPISPDDDPSAVDGDWVQAALLRSGGGPDGTEVQVDHPTAVAASVELFSAGATVAADVGIYYRFRLIDPAGSSTSASALGSELAHMGLWVDVVIPPGSNYPTEYRFAHNTLCVHDVLVNVRLPATAEGSESEGHGEKMEASAAYLEALATLGVRVVDGRPARHVRALNDLVRTYVDRQLCDAGSGDQRVLCGEGCVLGIKAYVAEDLLTDYERIYAAGGGASGPEVDADAVSAEVRGRVSDSAVDATGHTAAMASGEVLSAMKAQLCGTAVEATPADVGTTRAFGEHPFWRLGRGRPAKPSSAMMAQRRSLPAWGMQGEIIAALQSHNAVVITGETGSGKTTQVPQFLNEHHRGQCKILICQPRRLAATSVAARVAEEMGSRLGDAAGYMIKGDVRAGPNCNIVFCTYGVLLRRLQGGSGGGGGSADDDKAFLATLAAVDYIMLDEVHERGSDSDLVLALLRNMLLVRNWRAGKASTELKPLKLIVMSATIATDRVGDYLQPCCGLKPGSQKTPILSIPGRMHHVFEHFKDVWDERVSIPDLDTGWRIGGPRRPGEVDYDLLTKLLLQLAGCGEVYGICQEDSVPGEDIIAVMEGGETVLVFMPGVGEIRKCIQFIEAEVAYYLDEDGHAYDDDDGCRHGRDGSGSGDGTKAGLSVACRQQLRNLSCISLHGNMSQAEQQVVFAPQPATAKGGGKAIRIVVSTNVAEASITIPGVTVVVDTCRVKQLEYNAERNMTCLVTQFAARDSLQQRKGRAGRTHMGRCFRLITRGTFDKLNEHSVPELLRIPLDEVIMKLKSMVLPRLVAVGGDSGSSTGDQCLRLLKLCLDAPSLPNIRKGIYSLKQLQVIATESGETQDLGTTEPDSGKLTPLGRTVAQFSCSPRVGRVLVYGVVFRCVYSACLLGAILSSSKGSPLTSNGGKGASTADRAGPDAGPNSDHLKVYQLTVQFQQLGRAVGPGKPSASGWALQKQRKAFCVEHGCQFDILAEIVDTLFVDFLGECEQLGFISDEERKLITRGNVSARELTGMHVNEHSNKPKLMLGLLVAGLYPNIAFILKPAVSFVETSGGAVQRSHAAGEYQ